MVIDIQLVIINEFGTFSSNVREIEEEKKAILQSILDDGFDPERNF